ncbi:MAG: hypothetical protein KGI54_10545 [Pseudomonadota bacterium]|nr:hypothetical protein [Pseudomonadota bacterium]
MTTHIEVRSYYGDDFTNHNTPPVLREWVNSTGNGFRYEEEVVQMEEMFLKKGYAWYLVVEQVIDMDTGETFTQRHTRKAHPIKQKLILNERAKP